MELKELNTASKVAEHLRSEGFNVVPISAGSKSPPKGFDLKRYFDELCDHPITDEDSIAMLHGMTGRTWAMDLDASDISDKDDILKMVFRDRYQQILDGDMVVKTPKKGYHIILRAVPDDIPPSNATYGNGEGVKIDIKTEKGLTMLPPSIYPEAHLGKYQFVGQNKPREVKWSQIENGLNKSGYFALNDLKNTSLRTSEGVDSLLRGKFKQGTRRPKLNSLYCKLRVRGMDHEEADVKVRDVNRRCLPPLPDSEIGYVIQYAQGVL